MTNLKKIGKTMRIRFLTVVLKIYFGLEVETLKYYKHYCVRLFSLSLNPAKTTGPI